MLVDDCGKDGCGKRIGEETAELMDKFVMENESLLHERLGIFYGEMDERLRSLPPKEQQQYLEGLVHAFDSVVRHAHPGLLAPFEREEFIGSVGSWAYSKTYHLKLDPEKRMRKLVESNSKGAFLCHQFAAIVHAAMGSPLTGGQELTLMNLQGIFMIKQMGLAE